MVVCRVQAEAVGRVLAENGDFIKRLAKVDDLKVGKGLAKPPSSAAGVCGGIEVFVPLKGIIDYEKERERLAKSLKDLRGRFDGLTAKLKNKNFLDNAPAEVVEKFKASHGEMKLRIEKLKSNLDSLA